MDAGKIRAKDLKTPHAAPTTPKADGAAPTMLGTLMDGDTAHTALSATGWDRTSYLPAAKSVAQRPTT